MIRILLYIFLACLVSGYYFSFGLTFLPSAINTKLVMAGMGVVVAGMDMLGNRLILLDKKFAMAISLAILFSLICFISTDVNQTSDYSYASYIVSFSVWSFAAYFVCAMIKWGHGYIDLKLLVKYLALVSVAQCALALIIDNVPVVASLVNQYIDQGQDFLIEVDRLYGIGASLDNAGVRFSIVLVLLSAVVAEKVYDDGLTSDVIYLTLAFLIITVIGNMISRTTLVGSAMGLTYMFLVRGPFKITINSNSVRFWLLMFLVIGLITLITIYFYNTNPVFKSQLRFAFEAFFNFFEKGEFRTDSTDKLNKTMWVWPETGDIRSWLIGKGLFDNWVFGTDIGYCRFVLYSGIIGLSVFAVFFIYNGLVFTTIFTEYRFVFILFIALTFIIWVKVSTDIYIIYALLYAVSFLENKRIKEQHS